MTLFNHQNIDFKILKERSYNWRWAEVEEGIIPLTAADMDFPIAEVITNDVQEYLSKGIMNYAPHSGLNLFKDAVAKYYLETKKVIAKSEHVLPVNAAANGLYLAVKTMVKKGDKVLVPNPVDFLFKKCLEKVGAHIIELEHIEGTADFQEEKLEEYIAQADCIMLCNPNNPLGKCTSAKAYKKLELLLTKHNVKVIADEIWADIDYNNTFISVGSWNEEIRRNTLIVSGLSKNFGLAGFRIGYIIAFDNSTFETLLKHSQFLETINGVSSIGQIAGAAAMNKARPWLKMFLNHLDGNRKLIESKLATFSTFESNHPLATFTFFPTFKLHGHNSESICQYALEEARVALVPGSAKWFGSNGEGRIRLTYATSDVVLNEAFERLSKVFD